MLAAVCGFALAGCITHKVTVVRDTPRTSVQFENDDAARIFYEALSRMPERGHQKESTTDIRIPVVFEYQRHVVTGPNAAFNAAVSQCDANHDGKITVQEAQAFAEQVARENGSK